MSTAALRDQAYEAFLSSSDLETWTASFAAFREIFEGDEDVLDARPVDVRRALTIALYTGWLSARCGDEERRDRTTRWLHDLGARQAKAPPSAGGEAILIQAVVAAAKGYVTSARELLKDFAAPVPVEIALLTVPQRATPRAAALKPYVLECAGHAFIPVLYFYGSALLDLGYQSSVDELLKRHGGASASSPAIDLRGQLLELAGSWSAARDQYAGSEWGSHAYRLAVCNLILGEPIDALAKWPPEAARKFTAGMLDFSGETDRAGVFRSVSFVRACRWSGFDNWLVHFELGRLGFQRRRHAEAERHLAAAARAAPEPYRFPIHSLRFTNLTWLGTAMEVLTSPEALEAGYAALQEQATEEQRARIRTWIGGFEGESELLEPVASSSDDYERGNAHQIRGSVPDALACWCSCISKSYTPRAFIELLKIFASYGFEGTAASLAETVELEGEASFFDLWELARAIAEVLEKQPPGRIARGLLKERLDSVEKRMEELVESEFQNAIRAFRYFLKRRRLSPALRMLTRAERLAEGPEELLLLAIGRRMAAGGGWDPRTLEILRLAQRQSSDRFERLIIARELVTMGDLASARTILSEEGAFSDTRDFTPIEYVVALQCAKVCGGEEHRKLLEAAAGDALKRDIAAGRFLRYGKHFLERLNKHLSGESLQIALPDRAGAPEAELSSWSELVEAIKRFQSSRQTWQELRLLNEQVEALSRAGSPCSRFALWGLHLDRFDAHLGMIDRLRPAVADDETPMARDLSLVRPRARQAAQLWRAHLLASEPAYAERLLGEIRAFFHEEKELTERWDRLRNAEAEEPSNQALGYAKRGSVLLEDIGTADENAALWPPFLNVRRAVVDDAKSLADRLQERAASVRERVGP